jgi:hypothetical protein
VGVAWLGQGLAGAACTHGSHRALLVMPLASSSEALLQPLLVLLERCHQECCAPSLASESGAVPPCCYKQLPHPAAAHHSPPPPILSLNRLLCAMSPRRYVYSLYWSLVIFSTVGFGDFHAHGVAEAAFLICYITMNIALGAYILGTITMLAVKGDAAISRVREKMCALEGYAKVRGRVGRRARWFLRGMCACVHVCMCACAHVCMCACVHVRMCACVHVCMCACAHVCMCACVHVRCCQEDWAFIWSWAWLGCSTLATP